MEGGGFPGLFDQCGAGMTGKDWRSWLDEFDSSVSQADGEQVGAGGDEFVDVVESRRMSFPRWWRFVAVGAVLMGIGAGVASIAVVKLNSDMRAASVTMTATVTAEPPVTSEVVAERCPDQVLADAGSPQGVVVAFQEAYFAADQKKIVGLVADDSYLQEVDWVTAVGDLKGSVWCAVTKEESDSTVAASVTVHTSGGEELLYIQTYTVVKVRDMWKIVSIEDRGET